jgi:hypothetical protein
MLGLYGGRVAACLEGWPCDARAHPRRAAEKRLRRATVVRVQSIPLLGPAG